MLFTKVKTFFKRWRAQVRCANQGRLWTIAVACRNYHGDKLYTLVAPSGKHYGKPSVNFDAVYALLEDINEGIISYEIQRMERAA